MERIGKKILLTSLLFALCLCFAFATSCKKRGASDSNETSSESYVESNGSVTVIEELSLDRAEANMIYGDELTLIPTYGGRGNEKPSWTTSNEGVATVKDGKITAVGCGNADITATYGDKTAKCSITVGFGNVRPELILSNTPDKLRIGKGNTFALNADVMFNGKKYACDYTIDVEDKGIAGFSEGKLVAVGIGSTKATIKAEWNSFGGALMEKTIEIEVFNDVTFNAFVAINGDAYVTNSATLYVTDEWAGVKYETSAKIEFAVRDNGEEKTVSGKLVSGDGVVSDENGIVKAISEGSAVYSATYRDSLGNDYSVSVNIEVVCPVVDYSDRIELCADNAFPVEEYFGTGATVTSAESEGKALAVNENVISYTAKGSETPSMVIKTNKGGYRFNNVYAYTRKINKQNFASTFTLTNGKILDGYYILGENIDGLTVSSQHTGNPSTYFKGTFDGDGHTIKATAGANGLFGAINDGATIKNVKFEFTFPEGTAACGLAKNQNTFNNNNPVYLKNVYVTTTNYTEQACCLMDNMPDGLEMTDVLVKINGNAALGDFMDVNSCRTALFRVDQAQNDGNIGSFLGKFTNIKVITESFIPMSNGKRWNGTIFAHYAYNDEDKLGSFTRENASKGSYGYRRLFDDNEEGSVKKSLFGTNTYVYYARADFVGGGIERFDTAEELIASGVTAVGSWNVE